MSTSSAILEANSRVTGPKLQHLVGLTGRTVLLPAEDAASYEALIASCAARWQPDTAEERCLTQSLADTEWRLMRIPELESGIYALGFRELAMEFADIEDEAIRHSAIRTQIYLTRVRQLNALGAQESRLRRQREKDTAALKQLRDERKAAANCRLTEAAEQYIKAVKNETSDGSQPVSSAQGDRTPLCVIHEKFGFEFSKEQIELRALDIQPDLFDAWYEENADELAA